MRKGSATERCRRGWLAGLSAGLIGLTAAGCTGRSYTHLDAIGRAGDRGPGGSDPAGDAVATGDPSGPGDPVGPGDSPAPSDPAAGDSVAGDPTLPCTFIDVDNDGFLPPECDFGQPVDCDDHDAARHPGAFDICGNGIDEDCNGSDAACAEAASPLQHFGVPGTLAVTNGLFSLVFWENDGWVAGDIRILPGSADNILYTGFLKNERLAAVSYFDVDFSWRVDAASDTSLITGPAVTQLVVDWRAGGAPTTGMAGTTRHTLYPDGRYLREETVQVDSSTADAWLLEYAALAAPLFDTVDWIDATGGSGTYTFSHNLTAGTAASPYEGTAGDAGSICVRSASSTDTVGWAHYRAGTMFPEGYRLMEVNHGASVDGSYAFLLGSEWVRYALVSTGTYQGVVQMVVDGTGTCSSVDRYAASYMTPLTLTPQTGALVTTEPGDSDHDGFNEATGSYEVASLDGYNLEVTANETAGVPSAPTLSLRVHGLSALHPPIVSVNGVWLSHGVDYLWQAQPGDGGWLFLNRPLADGDVLVVVVPAAMG